MFGSMALLLVLSLIGAQCEQQPAATPTTPQSGPGVTPSPTKPAMPTQPAEPTYINLNLGTEPPTIDPGLAGDNTTVQCDELLFLGLTDYDQSLEVIPELAQRWSASSDGLKWTFTMRQDVRWVQYDPASGKAEIKRPVTARDVEYGVKRTLDPATGSGYAYVLYVIKEGEAFNTAPVTNPVSADTVGGQGTGRLYGGIRTGEAGWLLSRHRRHVGLPPGALGGRREAWRGLDRAGDRLDQWPLYDDILGTRKQDHHGQEPGVL